MKEKLIQYVDLLFAGTESCEDIKQEILQNTLDRYSDLCSEGKSPEAAYRLAIIGIGDINEILGTAKTATPSAAPAPKQTKRDDDTPTKKFLRAIAVGMYILCPVPVIVLGNLPGLEIIGVCGLLAMVAVATVLIILGSAKEASQKKQQEAYMSPQAELRKSIDSAVWAIGLAIYFVISFATGEWFITWVMFPIIGAVQGLIKAILDLKEANRYEG